MTELAHTLDAIAKAAGTGDAKAVLQQQAFALAYRALSTENGAAAIYALAPRFDGAGLFDGSDWARPAHLQPGLVERTLSTAEGIGIECCSQLRFLAIANGDAEHPKVTPDQARRFLERVLALNLTTLSPAIPSTPSDDGPARAAVQRLFELIIDALGADGILAHLVEQAERILLTRPIKIDRVRRMIDTASQGIATWGTSETGREAALLVDALYGPTPLARAHGPDLDGFGEALAGLDDPALLLEADTMATTMQRTGLVSPQHAVLVHVAAARDERTLLRVLGIEEVGRCSLRAFEPVVREIIDRAIGPATAQAVYGLAQLLDRGVLFHPAVIPALHTLLALPILDDVAAQLLAAVEHPAPPPASSVLLAGTLNVLGLPRGVDQGDNPTCQSARAISLWAQNDPGYLLELIAQAARDGRVVMYFEGQAIDSTEVERGVADELHPELDAISLLLTPHVDRIYWEMSRRALGRAEDEHKWVNPELHGWWVRRGFAAIIDEQTGQISAPEAFIRMFYAAYHPGFNGGRAVMIPQPVGVATTNADAAYLDWHAVSLQRVAYDPAGELRVYFFNPNHDTGENWGDGAITSTSDRGELMGESSLPLEQFASRLYVFHYDSRAIGDPDAVPGRAVDDVLTLIRRSWGRSFPWAQAPRPAIGGCP